MAAEFHYDATQQVRSCLHAGPHVRLVNGQTLVRVNFESGWVDIWSKDQDLSPRCPGIVARSGHEVSSESRRSIWPSFMKSSHVEHCCCSTDYIYANTDCNQAKEAVHSCGRFAASNDLGPEMPGGLFKLA